MSTPYLTTTQLPFINNRENANKFEIAKEPSCLENTLSSHYDCSKYYQCQFGQKIERNCGPNTYFNPITNICDWQSNVVKVRKECFPSASQQEAVQNINSSITDFKNQSSANTITNNDVIDSAIKSLTDTYIANGHFEITEYQKKRNEILEQTTGLIQEEFELKDLNPLLQNDFKKSLMQNTSKFSNQNVKEMEKNLLQTAYDYYMIHKISKVDFDNYLVFLSSKLQKSSHEFTQLFEGITDQTKSALIVELNFLDMNFKSMNWAQIRKVYNQRVQLIKDWLSHGKISQNEYFILMRNWKWFIRQELTEKIFNHSYKNDSNLAGIVMEASNDFVNIFLLFLSDGISAMPKLLQEKQKVIENLKTEKEKGYITLQDLENLEMQLEFGVQSYAEYITISHNVEITSTVPIVSSTIQDFSTIAPTPKFYCNCPGLPNIFMNKSCTCGHDFLWNGTSCIQSLMCPCYYNSRR